MARPSVKEERRAQILDGLFAAMAASEQPGASITDIAKAAGIARGALHYYFESKDEIRVMLMRTLGERYLNALTSFVDDADDPLWALASYHFGKDVDQVQRLLAVWIDFWGQASKDSALSPVVFDIQEGARQLCMRVLQPHHPDAPDEALRARASMMLAVVEGGLLQWRVSVQHGQPFSVRDLRQSAFDALSALAQLPLGTTSLTFSQESAA